MIKVVWTVVTECHVFVDSHRGSNRSCDSLVGQEGDKAEPKVALPDQEG